MPSSGQYTLFRLDRRSSRPAASSSQASPARRAGSDVGNGRRRRLPLGMTGHPPSVALLASVQLSRSTTAPSTCRRKSRGVPTSKEAWFVKTIWKGAISFGLVTIPVRVYGATEEKSLRFHQLHAPDGGRIRYKRVCAADGEEVDYADIVKGYEYEKDHYVTLTDEELDSLPVPSAKAIEIERFVEAEEIDPIYFQKSYYLVPEGTGVKAYHLLREAMADDGKVALAKVAFRDKEHLATLRLRDNVFVLETMYWPDEIRVPKFDVLDESVELRPQEIRMARSLIDSLTDAFKPDEFHDEYRAALEELVAKKIQGEEITYTEEAEPSKVVDLMEALRASVEAAKSGKPAEGKAAGRRRKKAA